MNENMGKEQGQAESPMAFNNGQKSCKMCGHGMCHCGYGHRHFWIKLVVGLIILAAAFCVGVKVGEFKSAFGRGFGRNGSSMMRSYRQPMQAYPLGTPGSRMMVVPNTATTTSAK